MIILSLRGNIVVDIGNSTIKAAKFAGGELVERKLFTELKEVQSVWPPEMYRWIFSSVGNNRSEIEALFQGSDKLILTKDTPLPLRINYKTPETLGMDRLGAAAGGMALFPDRNILIIDAGTCITHDIVTADGTFQGGVIAPGLRMRMKAMSQFTRQLPDIGDEWSTLSGSLTGKTTKECLLNGSFTGIIHEINGFLTSFKKEYDDLVVVLTGGDGPYFESILKQPIFADQNLVLKGLNRILNHNK